MNIDLDDLNILKGFKGDNMKVCNNIEYFINIWIL
jgi:hypothetical protein